MQFLKGEWGDRLTSLFSLRRPVQWILGSGIIPVVNVGDFIAEVSFEFSSTASATQGYLTVPDDERWYIFWHEIAVGASMAMALYLEDIAGGQQIQTAAAASGTRLYAAVDAFLGPGQRIYGSGASSTTIEITALVLKYKVRQP